MPRSLKVALSLLIIALIVGVPLWHYRHRRAHLRNFRVVEEGVLYRSGQMSVEGLRRVLEKNRIKTIVNLRDGVTTAEQAEEALCRERGVRYVSIIQKPWSAPDSSVPADEGVKKFIAVMSDPGNYPVLLHCFAGHHRTGTYCAIYRMEFGGWSQQDAIGEMYHLGYDTIANDRDVHRYLKDYRPGK